MRKLVLVAVLVLVAGGAQAVSLIVVGGQLAGASNVLVDGSVYDVQFKEFGSCADFYSGCNNLSDFTIQSQQMAFDASVALLDQVFADGPDGFFA